VLVVVVEHLDHHSDQLLVKGVGLEQGGTAMEGTPTAGADPRTSEERSNEGGAGLDADFDHVTARSDRRGWGAGRISNLAEQSGPHASTPRAK
jgi:hypothetical protein